MTNKDTKDNKDTKNKRRHRVSAVAAKLLVVLLIATVLLSTALCDPSYAYTYEEIGRSEAYAASSAELLKLDYSKASKGSIPKKDATVRMWNLIQNHSDPNYFTGRFHSKMETYYQAGKLKGKKYNKLVKIAKKKTAGCKTDYEKMRVLSKYVAGRTYYDYRFFTRITQKTNTSAYDVWKNKYAVCHGYANLYWTMLDALDIPCMMVRGKGHVFNAAYDRASKRWVFIDVTWCSGNRYYSKKNRQKGAYNGAYFDMSLNYILSLPSHEIYGVEGVLKNNVYYAMTPGYDKGGAKRFRNLDKWHWKAVCQKKKKPTVKLASKIGKYKVEEIERAAFFARPDIKKVYVPSTIKKIGKYAFCLRTNRHIIRTTVITKLPRSKLRINKGWRWWSRSIRIKKG